MKMELSRGSESERLSGCTSHAVLWYCASALLGQYSPLPVLRRSSRDIVNLFRPNSLAILLMEYPLP